MNLDINQIRGTFAQPSLKQVKMEKWVFIIN